MISELLTLAKSHTHNLQETRLILWYPRLHLLHTNYTQRRAKNV